MQCSIFSRFFPDDESHSPQVRIVAADAFHPLWIEAVSQCLERACGPDSFVFPRLRRTPAVHKTTPKPPRKKPRGPSVVQERLHLPVTKIDATAEMMAKLKGVSDPEAKRKAIGGEFIECFKRFRCAPGWCWQATRRLHHAYLALSNPLCLRRLFCCAGEARNEPVLGTLAKGRVRGRMVRAASLHCCRAIAALWTVRYAVQGRPRCKRRHQADVPGARHAVPGRH